MRIPSKDLKKGDTVVVAGGKCVIGNIEFSEIGKQGKRKARIEVITEKNEKLVVIRPEDYPFERIK